MRFGSLFAGIGGFDLGLERSGMECAWQVEIDPWCRQVLAKHWPDVPRYEDVRDVGRRNLEPVDLICGGFPCQDISNAGNRAGIEGDRSGLWTEYARIIRELRPQYIIVENVAALLVRGMGTVLGDLAACGYDAEWQVLSAAAFGAPHIRERIFILAYAEGGATAKRKECTGRAIVDGCSENVSYAEGQQWRQSKAGNRRKVLTGRIAESGLHQYWASQPGVCRVVDGLPGRLDRNTGLGNAVLPQVAEWLGRRIVEVEGAQR